MELSLTAGGCVVPNKMRLDGWHLIENSINFALVALKAFEFAAAGA